MRDAYIKEGRFQEALHSVAKYIQPRDPLEAWLSEMRIYSEWGRTREAERALARFEDAVRDSPADRDSPANRVQIYIAMGQKDQAIALLQKGFLEHSHLMTELIQDPIYDFLRGDPRFQDLLRRLRLAN